MTFVAQESCRDDLPDLKVKKIKLMARQISSMTKVLNNIINMKRST